HNEKQVALGDAAHLSSFAKNVETLAVAWQLNHDDAAARRAGEWLRAWFITPATRMNPNLEFAQVRLGHNRNHGSPAGVLDARCFRQIVEALQRLHDSPAFSREEESGIQAWFKAYFTWLTTAPNARAEQVAKNNHGSWFLVQIIPIARYCGHEDLARELCEGDKARIASQVKPDGSQPDELRRVDGLSYSVFNLEAHFQVARLASESGIDLWNYTAPSGASLRRALEFLRPYNAHPESWPGNQNAELKPGFLDALLKQAKAVWPDFVESGKT
ncbi:MAG: Alginate lyase, partial [Verrucomicrobia bacterium]|nr:Alginate lyase [Verrucomicrobiota bacterium]